MKVSELDTPAVLIDIGVLQRNITAMAARVRESGIRLRPHVKTHKSPEIARMQIVAGASGLTVAKLGEAEVFADHGFDDILIAYPIIGRQKLARLAALARDIRVKVALDSREVAQGVSAVGDVLGTPIPVLVEINTGLNRCGLEPAMAAVEFVRSLRGLTGVKVVGLLTHAGHAYQARNLSELRQIARGEAFLLLDTAELLAKHGFVTEEISVGSTPTVSFAEEMEGVTEVRPGTYVFNDYNMVSLGVADIEACALSVLSTVVSRPDRARFILDAGSKTLAADHHVRGAGFGYVKGMDCTITRLSEEHAVVESEGPVAIGDQVAVVPNHACPVINLAERVYLVKDEEVIGEMAIKARGRNV